MAGITALAVFEGPGPTRSSIAPMVDVLASRGPDGNTIWTDGTIGLGHCRSATTPTTAIAQPVVLDDGRLAIVADVRLDNREGLRHGLGLDGPDHRELSNAELVLRAYRRWGEECPTRLLGDFAFIVWDAPRRRVFCARDHFGVKPLAYHHRPGQAVAIGSTAQAVVAAETVPTRINEGRIGDFLVDVLEGIDATSTFYEDVVRLPPAHSLTVTPDGLRCRRYWELEPGPLLRLDSDQAYAEAFLAVFSEAVACRLPASTTTGSMLSGGMDSGAIVAVARQLLADGGEGPLRTYSAIAATPSDCPESAAVAAAQSMSGLAPTTVDPLTWNGLRPDLEALTLAAEEPFDAHMTLNRAVYLVAARQGERALLDGIDGDNVLDEGSQLRCLLAHGRWLTAWREASGLSRFWGGDRSAGAFLMPAAKRAFAPATVRRLGRRSARRNEGRLDELLASSLISRSFAERIDLVDRLATLRSQSGPAEWRGLAHERAAALRHPYLTVGLERYDRVAGAVGIEPRHPFLDLRLVDLALSLPGDQKLADGWPKAILRSAMAGRLPDAVRWRRGKEHLGYDYTLALWDEPGRLTRIISDRRSELAAYLDVDRCLGWLADPSRRHAALTAVQLAAWLDPPARPATPLPFRA